MAPMAGGELWENGVVARGEHHDPVADAQRPRRRFRFHRASSRRAQVAPPVFLAGAVFLIPWTVFLGLTLPPKYDARNWGVLWTGFDAALISVLLLAAWAARYRRRSLATITIVAGTLLICDAWFDMVSSFGNRDDWLTLLTGFGGELPLGLLFLWLSHRENMKTLTARERVVARSRWFRGRRDRSDHEAGPEERP